MILFLMTSCGIEVGPVQPRPYNPYYQYYPYRPIYHQHYNVQHYGNHIHYGGHR